MPDLYNTITLTKFLTERKLKNIHANTFFRQHGINATQSLIVRHHIPGAIVECGVWRGGSMMAVALTLLELQAATRPLYLYDTFDGMPPPTARDRSFAGESAATILQHADKTTHPVWAYSPLDQVQHALRSTGYPSHLLHYIVGTVEQTLPAVCPDTISLLRLDTDWYESTRHELVHLYPRLAPGGVLLIDDYGQWQGCRQAVDEYLHEHQLLLLLHRIDYTGRMAIKPLVGRS